MAKLIRWTEQAKADLRAIDRKTAMEVLHKLARFVSTQIGDVKRLQDTEPPELRLRVGSYRIRFYDRGDFLEILSVHHRKDAYRD